MTDQHKPDRPDGDGLPAANTDRELWREHYDEGGEYYADSIHLTKGGGIGINCGGTVYVKPLREWHRLATRDGAEGAEPPFGKTELIPDANSSSGYSLRAVMASPKPAPDAMRDSLTRLVTRHIGVWLKESNPALQIIPVAVDQDIRDLVKEILTLSAPVPSRDGPFGKQIRTLLKFVASQQLIAGLSIAVPSPDGTLITRGRALVIQLSAVIDRLGGGQAYTSTLSAMNDFAASLPPSGVAAAPETEQQIEDRLMKQDAADMLRLIDHIADKIGLPHDQELSRDNFNAWLASPPVRGDREAIEVVADAIDAARYNHPEHPRSRLRTFAEADRSDREYAFRLAKAAIHLPVLRFRNGKGRLLGMWSRTRDARRLCSPSTPAGRVDGEPTS